MSVFGDVLHRLRKEKSLTQTELAHALHVSPGTISNYETGVHYPDVEKLVDIAVYFEVTTDYLLGLTNSPLSSSLWEAPLLSDKATGEIVQKLQTLSEEQKKALQVLLYSL